MDAFGVLHEVLDDYQNFITGFLEIKEDQIRTKVESEIADGLLWPEPWLALNQAFESGGSVGELVKQNVLHPEAENIFRARHPRLEGHWRRQCLRTATAMCDRSSVAKAGRRWNAPGRVGLAKPTSHQ